MAHGRPWYQRHGGDFIAGTVGMDLETRGAYSLIIDYLNDRDRALPDDDRFVAGLLGVSTRKWRSIRATLLADPTKLVLDGRGDLTNPRFERERAERLKGHAEAVENGRAGGRKSAAKRAEKSQLDAGSASVQPRFGFENHAKTQSVVDEPQHETAKINDLGEPPPQARARVETRDQRLEKIESQPIDSPEPEPDVWAQGLHGVTKHLADLAGISIIAPTAIARAMDVVKAWRADGLDFANVVEPAIKRFRLDNPEQAIHSLAYFDRAVRTAATLGKHGKPKGPAAPPPPPIDDKDDDDPRIVAIRDDLRKRHPGQYGSWLKPERVGMHVNGVGLIVKCGTPFHREWIEGNLMAELERAASAQGIDGVRITL